MAVDGGREGFGERIEDVAFLPRELLDLLDVLGGEKRGSFFAHSTNVVSQQHRAERTAGRESGTESYINLKLV